MISPSSEILMQPHSTQQCWTACMRESECHVCDSEKQLMFVVCKVGDLSSHLKDHYAKKPLKWSLDPLGNLFNPRIIWRSWGKEYSPLLLFISRGWAMGVVERARGWRSSKLLALSCSIIDKYRNTSWEDYTQGCIYGLKQPRMLSKWS